MGYVLVLGGKGDIGSSISESLEQEYRGDVVAVGTKDFDLGNRPSIDGFFKKKGIEVDVLVHCAGWNKPQEFASLPYDGLERTIEINLMGFLYAVKKLIPYWEQSGWGRVVVISSLYGFLARKGRLPYVVSKHGLLGAVKTLAIELGPLGVLVNAVTPGYIQTKMTVQNNSPGQIETMRAGIPTGRLGEPQDVALAVAFLASRKNQYINGHDLVVDGGYSVGGFL